VEVASGIGAAVLAPLATRTTVWQCVHMTSARPAGSGSGAPQLGQLSDSRGIKDDPQMAQMAQMNADRKKGGSAVVV
jgi:hypothetical protein